MTVRCWVDYNRLPFRGSSLVALTLSDGTMKLCIRRQGRQGLENKTGTQVVWNQGRLSSYKRLSQLKLSWCSSATQIFSLFWEKMSPGFLIKRSRLRKQPAKKSLKNLLLSLTHSHFPRCGEQQRCGLVFRPCCGGSDSGASDHRCHSLPKEPERVRCRCHRLLRPHWGLPVLQLQDFSSRWAGDYTVLQIWFILKIVPYIPLWT